MNNALVVVTSRQLLSNRPMQVLSTSGTRSAGVAARTRRACLARPARPRRAFLEGREACKLVKLSQQHTTSAQNLLVYLPGTDGTGQSIRIQVPSLQTQGYEVWSLYMPIEDRSQWPELTSVTAALLHDLTVRWHALHGSAEADAGPAITLVCESFGGCLGLRVALLDPSLVQRLVLVNPATSFKDSLNGLSALVSGTNLLGIFPQAMYSAAQTTLLPLLVDSKRITPEAGELLRSMISMEQPQGTEEASMTVSLSPTSPLLQSPTPGADGSSNNGSALGGQLPLPLGLPTYGPAAAANFRVHLLREGNLSNEELQAVAVPTLILSSARDRLLPSIQEGSRLLRLIPGSVRIILPDSGHAALLEHGVDLAALMQQLQLRRDGQVMQGRLGTDQVGARGITSGAQAIAQSSGTDTWTEWAQTLAPWRDLVSPVVLGAENLPPVGSKAWGRPMLFVGNHGKMGFYDTPLLMYELFVRGYRVRGLAHPGHWKGPFGSFFEKFGAVKASPMAAFRLLKSNEKVLLFPGGAREVVKKRGEEYQLLWKDSPDFVRLAAKCKAIVVPFAAVGADDAYDVIMETDEQLELPVVGDFVRNLVEGADGELQADESIFPLTRMPVLGLPTPIPIPNLTRLYFKFAPPINTADLDVNDHEACQALYDNIKGIIKQDLTELLALREGDGEREVQARLVNSVSTLISTAQQL